MIVTFSDYDYFNSLCFYTTVSLPIDIRLSYIISNDRNYKWS